MTALHDDPRVRRGMERQLELRRRILDDGARPIGWKLGLGTAAAMEQHGTSAPLVGFLTDRGLREPDSAIEVGAWSKPTAEPEIAVHLATDVPADGDRDAVAAAIGGLGVAFELVDITGGDVEEILAGDIFHRHVVLGPATPVTLASAANEPGAAPPGALDGAALDDLRGEIRHGEDAQAVDDPLALVGDPVAAVAHLASHLAAFGETVRAGEVLITGSIVPALAIAPGDRLDYRLEPLGGLTLRFVD
jgi:2-keto-4-pentenoate hydratase